MRSLFHLPFIHVVLMQPSKRGIGKVVIKVRINEWHNGASKISSVERRLRDGGEVLPRNKRLRATNSSSETAGVVDRPDTLVLDERRGAGEGEAISRAVPVSVRGWADG